MQKTTDYWIEEADEAFTLYELSHIREVLQWLRSIVMS
jgi:hypothetical protein